MLRRHFRDRAAAPASYDSRARDSCTVGRCPASTSDRRRSWNIGQNGVGVRQDADLVAVGIQLAGGQCPQGHVVGHGVEVGAGAAAAEAHRRTALVDDLGYHGAGGAAHRRRNPLVNPRHRLAEDQSLLSVRKQQDELGGQREVRQGPVDRVPRFTLQCRDCRDLVVAHVVQPAHGLQRLLQLAAVRCRCRRQVMRVDADRAQCVIRRRGGKGTRRRLLPEAAAGGYGAVKGRDAGGRRVAERHGNRRQGQVQRGCQLVGQLRVCGQGSFSFLFAWGSGQGSVASCRAVAERKRCVAKSTPDTPGGRQW